MSYSIKPITQRVATSLAASGVTISPKKNSFFEPIVGALQAPLSGETLVSNESMANDVNGVYKRLYGKNPFATPSLEEGDVNIGNYIDVVNEAAFNEIKPVVLGIIEKIKNQVNPTVQSIYDTCTGKVQDIIGSGGIKINVVKDGMELPVWTNPRVVHLCNPTGEYGVDWLTMPNGINFPEKTDEELKELLTTGDDLFDAELRQLLATRDADCVSRIYGWAFGVGGGIDGICTLTVNLVAGLLATRLIDDIVDGLDNIDLEHYTIMLRRMANSHGQQLKSKLAQRESLRKTGYMIYTYPEHHSEFSTGGKIVVDGLLYERYLELQGEVDAIYGAYINGGREYRNIDNLLENANALCKDWFRHVSYGQQSKRDDFQRIYLGHLRVAIINQAKEMGIGINIDSFDKMFNRSSSLTEDKIFNFTRRAVIHCLYPDSEYLTILENVDAVCEQHEGIAFEDVIQLAIIDWLVSWALTHVDIKAVKVNVAGE